MTPALQDENGMMVVLFCGGLGMRLRELTQEMPKPMVRIGEEPILIHLMRYYAHFGHRRFVLCLGHLGEVIIRHFLKSPGEPVVEALTGEALRVHMRDSVSGPWTVTLVPTGLDASIGERLRTVRNYIDGEVFLANYADGLSDLELPTFLRRFGESGAVAGLLSVRLRSSMHLVASGEGGFLTEMRPVAKSDIRINGGFFAFRRRILDLLLPGEDLVDDLFPRLVETRELFGHVYDGFWGCMDTAKDWYALESMDAGGEAPWKVWRRISRASAAGAPLAQFREEPAYRLLGVQREVGELQ
jgi:glucose-1-phosphate cytidylyltransferase